MILFLYICIIIVVKGVINSKKSNSVKRVTIINIFHNAFHNITGNAAQVYRFYINQKTSQMIVAVCMYRNRTAVNPYILQ